MKEIDVMYKGQIKIPKMEFVGGYPNEYCIFLENLSAEELKEIKTIDGKVLNLEEFNITK